MSAARVCVIAAICSFAAWALKGVAIAIAGGLDESALESPLFGIGMLALAVALGAFGVAVTSGRPSWLRALAAVGAVVVGVLATILIQEILKALLPASSDWVQEEAGLWVASLLAAILAVTWFRGREPRRHDSS